MRRNNAAIQAADKREANLTKSYDESIAPRRHREHIRAGPDAPMEINEDAHLRKGKQWCAPRRGSGLGSRRGRLFLYVTLRLGHAEGRIRFFLPEDDFLQGAIRRKYERELLRKRREVRLHPIARDDQPVGKIPIEVMPSASLQLAHGADHSLHSRGRGLMSACHCPGRLHYQCAFW